MTLVLSCHVSGTHVTNCPFLFLLVTSCLLVVMSPPPPLLTLSLLFTTAKPLARAVSAFICCLSLPQILAACLCPTTSGALFRVAEGQTRALSADHTELPFPDSPQRICRPSFPPWLRTCEVQSLNLRPVFCYNMDTYSGPSGFLISVVDTPDQLVSKPETKGPFSDDPLSQCLFCELHGMDPTAICHPPLLPF